MSAGAPQTAPGTALDSERLPGEAQTLGELHAILGDCHRCGLADQRNHVVFGEGSATAKLLLVGEGPGYQEDRTGRPFVGPAGELLTRILAAIGISRDEVFICNIVKCRPPQNRDPQGPEVGACLPFVARQIELVQPKVIVALGRVAAQNLLGTTAPIGRLRGRFHDYRGIPVMPTYHPAALLREASYKRPVWEDMKLVRDRLESP